MLGRSEGSQTIPNVDQDFDRYAYESKAQSVAYLLLLFAFEK